MFDITKESVVETAWMNVKGLDGEYIYADAERTKPARILFYGPGSTADALVESRVTARTVKRMNDNDGKLSLPPLEERQRETAEDLAAVTVRHENFDYKPAGKAEGAEFYTALYLDPKLDIAAQGRKFRADRGNFKAA